MLTEERTWDELYSRKDRLSMIKMLSKFPLCSISARRLGDTSCAPRPLGGALSFILCLGVLNEWVRGTSNTRCMKTAVELVRGQGMENSGGGCGGSGGDGNEDGSASHG
jgi:hypothetical protein